MRRAILSTCLILTFAAHGLAGEPQNLIPNNSFEVDAGGDGMPDGWTFNWQYTHSNDRERGVKKQKPIARWDSTTVHSGKRSLFAANERPEDGVWTLAVMPLDSSAKYYKLQAWIKTRHMEKTEALVSAVFLGDQRKWLGANLDLTGWHPEVLRFGYRFGLYEAGGTGVIEWSYQTAFRPDKPELVYEKEDTIFYQYPQVGDETGGPTLAWEATREGVDDYRYLFTLNKLVEELTAKGDRRANRAQALWRKVEQQLRRIDFTGSTGSAAQGDWTGRKELSPEGDKIVSGDHKMANGLRFGGYDTLRRKIADAILELTSSY